MRGQFAGHSNRIVAVLFAFLLLLLTGLTLCKSVRGLSVCVRLGKTVDRFVDVLTAPITGVLCVDVHYAGVCLYICVCVPSGNDPQCMRAYDRISVQLRKYAHKYVYVSYGS